MLRKSNKPLDTQLDAILRSDASPTEKLAAFVPVFHDFLPQYPHLANLIERNPAKVRDMLWQLIQNQDAASGPLQTLPPALPKEPVDKATGDDAIRMREEHLKDASRTTVLERGNESGDWPTPDEESDWKKTRDTALGRITAKETAADKMPPQRQQNTDSALRSLHRALKEISYALEDEKKTTTPQMAHAL